jgi:hypothetical protein
LLRLVEPLDLATRLLGQLDAPSHYETLG